MDVKRTVPVGGESSGVVGVACFEDHVYVVCARSKLVHVLAGPESNDGPNNFEVSFTMKVEKGKTLETSSERTEQVDDRIDSENCQATCEDLQSGHWRARNGMAEERVKGGVKKGIHGAKVVDRGADKRKLDKGDDIVVTGEDGLADVGKHGDDSRQKEVEENAKNEVRKKAEQVKCKENPEKGKGMGAGGRDEVHENNNRKEPVPQTTGGSKRRRGKRSKKKDNEADEQKDKKAAEQKAEVTYSMIDPQDMVCSDICRSIFISDRSCRCLWQIQLLMPLSADQQMPGREISQIVWVSETGWPQKMSTTPSQDLLVVCRRADRYNLAICRPWEGAVDRPIALPTKIIYVWHAVQTWNGNFVISHLNRTILDGPPVRLISELSVEDGNGNIIRTFDPTLEDSIDLTRWRPYHLAIDHTSDRLFITDSSGRCRVLALDSDLTQIRILLDRDAHQLHQPERLCFIPNKKQLYVGQTDWTRSSCPSSVVIYNSS